MHNQRSNTTIRLSPDEREEIEVLMKEYGYSELSPFFRFAVQKLRRSRE